MKKKIVGMMLTMMMLTACGEAAKPTKDLPEVEQSISQTVAQESEQEQQTQAPLEGESINKDLFENDSWKEAFEYTIEMIETHDQDAFMKDFRDQVEAMQE